MTRHQLIAMLMMPYCTSLSPEDTGPIDALFNFFIDVKSWITANYVQLNRDKN